MLPTTSRFTSGPPPKVASHGWFKTRSQEHPDVASLFGLEILFPKASHVIRHHSTAAMSHFQTLSCIPISIIISTESHTVLLFAPGSFFLFDCDQTRRPSSNFTQALVKHRTSDHSYIRPCHLMIYLSIPCCRFYTVIQLPHGP